ncbi:MAG: cell division protein FtsA [Gammaproteobacteria bacterium]|nr:cell division protein FtsA [Gammaproteobacteria bacterium]
MICNIDFGTSKITTTLASSDTSDLEIHDFSSVSTSGLKKGSIINISDTAKAVEKSINNLQIKTNFKIKNVFVSFSGESISSTNSMGVAEIKDKQVSYKDMESAWKTSISMSVPKDKELIDVITSQFIIDGQSGIKDPRGMYGGRLEVSTHLVYCSKNAVNNLKKCVEKINGLKIKRFFYNQLGTAESVLSNDQKELGVCLIDIGAGTTDITVYKKGAILFSKVLPYAGDLITESIAMSLKIPSFQAEQIKVKYGSAISDEISDEILKIKGLENNKELEISKKALCEIIEQNLSTILRNCVSTIEQNGLQDSIGTGLVLTGGTANLENITKLGKIITQKDCLIGSPENLNLKYFEKLNKPQFGASLGMMKYCAEVDNKEFTFNRSKGIIGRMLEWLRSEM